MRKTSFAKILVDAILALCCAVAAASAVPTAYGTGFILSKLVFVTALCALALSALVHLSGKLWPIPCVLFAGGAAVYFDLVRDKIETGAKLVWDGAGSLLSLSFSILPVPGEPPVTAEPEIAVTAFLIFVSAIFVLFAVILLVKCRPTVPKLLLPLPPFVLTFIYYECRPALFAVILLLIYWAGAVFGREKGERSSVLSERGRLLFIMLAFAVGILLPLFIPEKGFEPIPFSERRGIIDTFGSIRDRWISSRSGNPREYDLLNESERIPDHSKAFSINSTFDGAIYLRTHSYGMYSGNLWIAADEYAGGWRSMQALSTTQYGGLGVICIRDARMAERLTPYAFLHNDEPDPGESYIRANGRNAYVWNCLTGIVYSPVGHSEAESDYYRFAMREYTLADGPRKTELLKIWNEIQDTLPYVFSTQDSWGGKLDDYQTALRVAECVKRLGEYTYSPGALPEGKDFVEYFLTENRRGYCVHFASATTALLQAMDIPARYVIGYRAEVNATDVWLDITKDNSHAWTEVYIRGIGWVPIESTATFPAYTSEGESAPAPTATPEGTEKPEFTFDPIDRSRKPLSTPKPTKEPRELSSPVPKPTEEPGGNGGSRFKPITLLWVLLGIAGAILVHQAIGLFIRRRREKSFRVEDPRKAVLSILDYLDSIRKYGVSTTPDADKLANEAAFSLHDMEKEREELLELVKENREKVFKFSPLKRFFVKNVLFKL